MLVGIGKLSAILAIGSSFWVLAFAVLWPYFLLGFTTIQWAAFLPGSVLWAFYATRWLAVPALWVRCLGWALSLLVQGTWLAWELNKDGTSPLVVWWGGACLVSAWALMWEHRVPTPSAGPPCFRPLPRA